MKDLNNKKIVFVILAVFMVAAGGIGAKVFRDRKAASSNSADSAVAKDKTNTVYHCPMHPAITSHEPGQCPICHMDLQKVDDEDDLETVDPGPAADAPKDEMTGRSGFSLSLEKQQLIGVASVHAERKPLSFEVRATGRVAFDPELFTAIEEYRQAQVTLTQAQSNSFEAIRMQAKELAQAAQTRLRLLGLSQQQIQTLAKNGSGMELLLPNGSVWVYAEIYEYEIGGIRSGQSISVQAPAVPGQTFTGKVSSISPIVNSPTRTVRVRALVPDPKGLLRPDTFVNVSVKIDYGVKLAVPEDAVMHSGNGAFVFIVKGKGRFEPRPITTGIKANHYYEILSGLEQGDAVVSSANFLIDSESRLRAALKNMQAPAASANTEAEKSKPNGQGAHAGHGGH